MSSGREDTAGSERGGDGFEDAPDRAPGAYPDDYTDEEGSVSRLLGEVLDAEHAGRPADLAGVLARAGPLAEEVRRRLARLRALEHAGGGPDPLGLGRFRKLRQLGRGGQGVVWLAHDPKLAREVVVKVLVGTELATESDRKRVRNEARSLARLEHEGIVRVLEVDDDGARDLLVLEHVDGVPLSRVIARLGARATAPSATPAGAQAPSAMAADEARGPGPDAGGLADRLASFRARTELLRRIAEALAYVHDRGVLHRDLKPANVLVDRAGRPVLIDFGLAHLASATEDARAGVTQELAGTEAYVAPEQVESGRTGNDPRSDQFSFGTLAYELLALENPFRRGGRSMTLGAIERGDHRPLRRVAPAVPVDLAQVVEQCLQRRPDDRYASMDQVAADLRAIAEHRPVAVRTATASYRARLWVRRNRRGLVALGVLLAVLVGGVGGARLRELAREHGELGAALGGLGLEGLTRPDELRAAMGVLEDERLRAARLDASLVSRTLFSAVAERVEEAVHAWSERVGEAMRAMEVAALAEGRDLQTVSWFVLLREEERLCPECPYNEELRGRGMVRVEAGPEGADFVALQQGRLGPEGLARGISVHRPFRWSSLLDPGAYRVVGLAADRTVLGEAECRLFSTTDPLHLLVPWQRREELFERATALDGGVWSTEVRDGQISTELRPYALSPRITAEELELFREQTGRSPLRDETGALCQWSTAHEYARWAGGRLPTWSELSLAVDHLDATAREALWPADHDPESFEYVSDFLPGDTLDMAMAVTYAQLLVDRYTVERQTPIRQGTSQPCRFRVAFTRAVER